MVKKIFRYEIGNEKERHITYATIELPMSQEPIRVDCVDGIWSLWSLVDPTKTVMTFRVERMLIPVCEKFEVKLPEGAIILHARDVDGLFYLWYMYDYMKITELRVPRQLVFFKTGQPIPDDMILSPLIGTCKLFIMQELCLYVFEDLTPEPEVDILIPS